MKYCHPNAIQSVIVNALSLEKAMQSQELTDWREIWWKFRNEMAKRKLDRDQIIFDFPTFLSTAALIHSQISAYPALATINQDIRHRYQTQSDFLHTYAKLDLFHPDRGMKLIAPWQ